MATVSIDDQFLKRSPKNVIYISTLFCGFVLTTVQLFLGTTDVFDTSKLIFERDGNFQTGADYTFIAAFDPEPTGPPLVPSQEFLTLELRMDL
jgi:hypothetical protein